MKRFDPQAILERQTNVLKSKNNWSNLQADGATIQLLESFAEPIAEVARYGEYLLQELKWDTSRNFSSTKHMARLVGKKLERKHSATGSIIVSHSDVTGVARYSFLGIDNFNIDSESNYDTLQLNPDLTETTYTHALVPWTCNTGYTIPKGTTFTTKDGKNFICAESKSISPCTIDWETIRSSASGLLGFKATDGWNNYKYLTVPVVQGFQKTVNLGISNGLAGQTFLVATLDIEAADNLYTKQFCYIEITDTAGETTTWTEIQHLQLANTTDKVFEIDILDDLSGTIIKFGDSCSGAIPPENAKIVFHYLETTGEQGNVTELYNFQNEINGAILPRDCDYKNLTVGCQNMWPIIGGKDLESLSEYKKNAETAYAKNYEILHTYSELEAAINSISPIPLIKVKISTFYETETINSTKVVLPKIGLTGLSTGVKPLNSTEILLFESILNAKLNTKVLSNKFIRYLSPTIVEINSSIQIEPNTSIVSKEAFKEELETYLTTNYGKTNINPIDCYKQADLLRGALTCSSNIGSIQATNMLATAVKDVVYGIFGNSMEKYFLFSFEYPNLSVDVTGIDGFCDRSLADGNETPYVFNISINGNVSTYVVQETKFEEAEKLLFEQADYFSDLNAIYLYKNLNTENARYNLKHLKLPKYTFSRKELQNFQNLAVDNIEPYATDDDAKGIYFYIQRSKDAPKFYLALSAQKVANCLGFKADVNDANIARIYNNLLGSIDNESTKITIAFEPTDKTVTGPWNTVIYYDHINVDVENTISATITNS